MSQPTDRESLDLLAELNAEFGKKPKGKKEDSHRTRNLAWHSANPEAPASAQGKLAEADQNYDWTMAKAGFPQPLIPEARVSCIIHQRCSCCHNTTWFTGNEYIRFRRVSHRYNVGTGQFTERKFQYTLLGGQRVDLTSTVLKRLSDCDPNLVAQGPADGDLLPQEISEIQETTPRCPACIMLEAQALDLFIAATKRAEDDLQVEINLD